MANLHEASASDVTLTPGTDGVSDYHQYLEKTSRRDSRGDASLVHPSTIEDSEIPSHMSFVDTPAPTLNNETELGVSEVSMFERIRPAHTRRKREQRPHQLDATEDSHEYPRPLALCLLTIGICLSVFLVSLDRTIVATVRLSDEILIQTGLN